MSPFKRDCLKGRVALITGGGSGIGFGIAQALGQHGCAVMLMGRRRRFLDEAVRLLQTRGIVASACDGDVRVEADAQRAVDAAVATFGKLDTLVNCAAGNFLATAEELSVGGFKTVMDIDAGGVFTVSRAAFKALRRAGDAVIVNISATLHYGATWYQSHACAAKAAVDALTRCTALEWGSHGIRVNGVAPGPIRGTPGMTKLAPEGSELMKAIEGRVGAVIPLGRMGETFEIGHACVFLCGPAASWITGSTLVVDGGSWLWGPPPMPRERVAELSRGAEGQSRRLGPSVSGVMARL
jgi:peroxisomal 2,4-dienoyl-CoA reductase